MVSLLSVPGFCSCQDHRLIAIRNSISARFRLLDLHVSLFNNYILYIKSHNKSNPTKSNDTGLVLSKNFHDPQSTCSSGVSEITNDSSGGYRFPRFPPTVFQFFSKGFIFYRIWPLKKNRVQKKKTRMCVFVFRNKF